MTETNETTGDKQAPASRRRIKSAFLTAFILFLSLNAWLSFYTPIQFDEYKFPYRGWAWWMMNDLRKNPEVHNVALLGSSLMVSAVAGCDANYLKRTLDLANYHKATYLDVLLTRRFGGPFNTFNLSAPGQMPSDAYLGLKAMVNCAHRPDVVIYGIAPRDFIDSTLSTPADTEPFKYFRRFVNIDDVGHKVFRSPFGKLDFWLERGVYLYGRGLDFQMCFNEVTRRLLERWVPQPFNNPRFTWWDRVRLLPGYLPGEIHPEAVMAGPIDRETASHRYKDNTREYQQRYRSPDSVTYRTQIFFLKQLIQFCHKERIELVLVNMPITYYNVCMLRPGIYKKYVDTMRGIAFESNVSFYDLLDFGRYPPREFHDSVHLNAFGGKKLMEQLVEALAADRRSSSAMTMAAAELQRHQMLANSEHGFSL